MTEPASSTITGAVLAFPTVTITGSLLGMQADALLIGFFFSTLAVLVLEPQGGTAKACGMIALASALAAMLSQVLLPLVLHYLAWLPTGDAGRLGCAALIGTATPTALPLLRSVAQGRAKQEGGL